MIFDWLRRRAERRAAIIEDAKALMDRHGENALFEARYLAMEEQDAGPFDNRPPGHWAEVRDEVRRLAKRL